MKTLQALKKLLLRHALKEIRIAASYSSMVIYFLLM